MKGCLDCGRAVHQAPEKAIGDGEVQMVWADDSGGWTCEVNGDEHRPADLSPYEVEFTVTVHVLAADEDVAFDKAEPFAKQAAADGAWTNYDDCSRLIEPDQF